MQTRRLASPGFCIGCIAMVVLTAFTIYHQSGALPRQSQNLPARRRTAGLERYSSTRATQFVSGSVQNDALPSHQRQLREQLKVLLQGMTTIEKIGQITQVDVSSIVENGTAFTINETAVREFALQGVGSYINSPTAVEPRAGVSLPTGDLWRQAMQQLRDTYTSLSKVPPIFGLDSIHGANYVKEAVIFPHPINLAATFSVQNAYDMARATAQSTRSSGVQWVFSPILDVAMAPHFPRVYESFGEDPFLVKAMGVAVSQGLQGQNLTSAPLREGSPYEPIPTNLSRHDVVASCMKHFVGYMASRSGHDRAPAWIPEVLLRSHFLPPFAAAVRSGAASVMSAYSSADGLPITSSYKWTQRWLREDVGFDGLLVTDWDTIYNLMTDHHSAESGSESVIQSMRRSSTDMAMVPGYSEQFFSDFSAAIKAGKISEKRLDAAVLRVLELKARVGLLGDLIPGAPREIEPKYLENPTDMSMRRQAADSKRSALQSIVLLSNINHTLPLNLNNASDSIAVVGPNAKSRKNLLGGWTVHWRGPKYETAVLHVQSVRDAFHKVSAAEVLTGTSVTADGGVRSNFSEIAATKATKAVVFVYGEGTYAETSGDVSSAYLPRTQLELAQRLRRICTKRGIPLIGVFIGGRDRLLAQFDELFESHLIAFYPGQYGGDAIASIIAGWATPSGRLPITLHRYDSQNMPYWQSHIDYERVGTPLPRHRPLYPFGHGISYVKFAYSPLLVEVVSSKGVKLRTVFGPSLTAVANGTAEVTPVPFSPTDHIFVRVVVTNHGDRRAQMPVLLFLSDDYRILPPEVKQLKAFARVDLEPGRSQAATFELTLDDFGFETNEDIIDPPGRMVQPGLFTLNVEGHKMKLKLAGDPSDEATWVRLTTYNSR